MDKKKNATVDLNKKKTLFFLSALLVSQSFVLYAFTFTNYEEVVTEEKKEIVQDDVEEIEITDQYIPPPPPPPPPEIQVSDDDSDADDDYIPPDMEFDPEDVIPPPPPPPPLPSDKPKEEKIWEQVEIMPEFPGGEKELLKFISENFSYPDEASRFGVEGRVIITFIVDESGRISDVRAVLPPEKQLGYGLEEEAIRVARKFPPWRPGQQANKKVKVRFTMPIICRLD
jgi:periplasmic protein TonB